MNNNISACGIKKYLDNKERDILCPVEIDSTNTALKLLAKEGSSEGTIIATEMQTAGKGRLGKSFFSPKGCGVYFSILLRPEISTSDSVFITVAASVAIRRALIALLGVKTQIKWVNDIYFDGKKLCGILTESVLSGSSLDCAVLGIGINIKLPEGGYPEEFAYKTTNIFEIVANTPDDFKNKLVAEIVNQFDKIYKELECKSFIEEYKEASCILGKKIKILSGSHEGKFATAKDIDKNASLAVILDNGKEITLSSGDVSICI